MKIKYLIIVLFFFLSCSVQKFSTFTVGKHEYKMNIPTGYTFTKATDDNKYKEYRFTYPDSSTIYMTDDNISGGSINTIKAKEYGQAIYLKIATTDTLDLTGKDILTFWREQKFNDIVIGYINAPENKKKIYDEVLSTLRKR